MPSEQERCYGQGEQPEHQLGEHSKNNKEYLLGKEKTYRTPTKEELLG